MGTRLIIRTSAVLALAGIAALSATSANATIGYYQHGYGARSIAMGGAGGAGANDSMAPAINPARILQAGNGWDIGITVFTPRRKYSADSLGVFGIPLGSEIKSGHNWFPIPNFGYVKQIDDQSAWAVTFYGNGGMNTRYPGFDRLCTDPFGNVGPGNGIFCGGRAGVNFMQIFMTATYARKLSERISVGISPIFGFQRMRILGLGAFAGFSQDPANVSDNGIEEGFGFGGRVGISAKMSDQVTFGASYQSKVYMSKFNDYAGLFANDGAFDAPATAIAGVAFNLSDKAMFEVNAQYIWYRAIPAIGNPFVSPGPIGSAGGPGFGWDNIFVLKVGAEFVASDKVTWRLGYTYNEQPVPSSEVLFNVIAPGVITNHITGGFSYKFGDGTLDFAAMFAPSESVSGINPISPFPQNIKLTMKQVALTIGWSKRF